LQRLEALGEYFSDEEMKRRDPLLYEDMIGQHLTDDDVKAMITADKEMKDHSLSAVLLQHIQAMQNNELYKRLKDAEVFSHSIFKVITKKLHCTILSFSRVTVLCKLSLKFEFHSVFTCISLNCKK